MKFNLLNISIILLLSLFFSSGLFGQFYNGTQMNFGKNRVQYEDFDWFYYKYPNYDVYFYQGGRELALYTAKYSKEIIQEMELDIGFLLEDRLQFVLFNNFTDLKQSNIGLINDSRYNTGGVTHIVGSKVILYFDGNHHDLEKQIRAGIAQTLINHMIYGSSLGAQIKNNSLFPFPEWFLKGLVSFYSEPWTTDIDDKVRDGIASGRYKNFNRLTGDDARWAGHSFWYFLSETYGRENIANILYLAKMSRRVQQGFLYSLQKPLKTLIEEWLNYYQVKNEDIAKNTILPSGDKILKRNKKNTVYQHIKLSPDGRYAAYVSNQYGRYKVLLKDLQTGKKKTIYKGAYRLDEKVDYSYPVLDWHPKGNILAFIVEKKGKPYMNYYSVEEKKRESIYMSNFEKILDFSYSESGYYMVVSAIQRGQSDIFVYDVGSNTFEQITRDIFDDRHPSFYHHDQKILFSSNRQSDTLKLTDPLRPQRVNGSFDLYMYDYVKRDPIMQQVTKTFSGDELKVQRLDTESFVFLSDLSGIQNIYLGKLDSTISFVDTTVHYRYFTHTFPLTNYGRNVLAYDINKKTNKLASIFYLNNHYEILLSEMPVENKLSESALKLTPFAQERQTVNTQEGVELGSQPNIKSPLSFYNVHQSDLVELILKEYDSTLNYSYEDVLEMSPSDSVYKEIVAHYPVKKLLQAGKEKKENDIPQRRNYYVEFFYDQVTTQLDFTNLYDSYQTFVGAGPIYSNNSGVQALFQVKLKDLMEDYRITGGVMYNMDFKNNEYLISYKNLKKRIDKEIVFHRKPTLYQYGYNLIKITFHELFYISKYPFNEVMSARGTLSYRHAMVTYLASDIYSLVEPNYFLHSVSAKGEFVFDNTKDIGINLMLGARAKVFAEYTGRYSFIDPNKKLNNVMVVGFDYRNYQRIHRSFIWANRIAGSTNFGNQKLIYFMGGVDNWILPKFNEYTPIDYTQGYAYQTIATNMRGFYQNIRNGNSFLVINSELRFPVFKYFSKFPLNSDFLNSFQLVGFGDLGTAWTGLSPYSEDNFLYTRHIDQNPMHIRVRSVTDPLVGGYGVGARAKVLGYFVRTDLAWGVENFKVRKPIFYISLSLDF